MKFIILTLLIAFIFDLHFHLDQNDLQKLITYYKKLTPDQKKELHERSTKRKEELKKDVNNQKRRLSLFSTTTTPQYSEINDCVGLEYVDNCDNVLNPNKKRECIVLNKFCTEEDLTKIQSKWYKNSPDTKIDFNQLIYNLHNVSEVNPTSLTFVRNVIPAVTWQLIKTIYDDLIPLTLKRVKLMYVKYYVEKRGSEKIPLVKYLYSVEGCSEGIYQNGCPNNNIKTQIGVGKNEFTIEDLISYVYIQERLVGMDQETSSQLTLLNDEDYVTETKKIFCEKLQNNVLSQTDNDFDEDIILKTCGSRTGTVGISLLK
jgi:hypothetical protein